MFMFVKKGFLQDRPKLEFSIAKKGNSLRLAIDFSRKNRRLTLQKQEKAGDLKNYRNKEKTGVFCSG